jgi:hypothetical protein
MGEFSSGKSSMRHIFDNIETALLLALALEAQLLRRADYHRGRNAGSEEAE